MGHPFLFVFISYIFAVPHFFLHSLAFTKLRHVRNVRSNILKLARAQLRFQMYSLSSLGRLFILLVGNFHSK